MLNNKIVGKIKFKKKVYNYPSSAVHFPHFFLSNNVIPHNKKTALHKLWFLKRRQKIVRIIKSV